jgi:hypothetical protein
MTIDINISGYQARAEHHRVHLRHQRTRPNSSPSRSCALPACVTPRAALNELRREPRRELRSTSCAAGRAAGRAASRAVNHAANRAANRAASHELRRADAD